MVAPAYNLRLGDPAGTEWVTLVEVLHRLRKSDRTAFLCQGQKWGPSEGALVWGKNITSLFHFFYGLKSFRILKV